MTRPSARADVPPPRPAVLMTVERARDLVEQSYADARVGCRAEYLVAARRLLLELQGKEAELEAQVALAQDYARKLQERP